AAAHVYADNGTYAVTLTVTDKDGGAGTGTLEVTVSNVAPTVSAGTDRSAVEGTAVTLTASSFNDKGTKDTHTATISWGDGTAPETGVVVETPFGPPGSVTGANGTVSGSHTYKDNGAFTVTVSVADNNGESASDTLVVTVTNVAPTVNAGADQLVTKGVPVNFAGTFTDPGADTHAF